MAIKDLTTISKHLFLCNGASCKLRGAEESTAAIRLAISQCGLSEKIHTTKTLCNGRCKDGPVVISMSDGIWFRQIDSEKADLFVKKFVEGNSIPWNDVLFKYGYDEIYTEEYVSQHSARSDDGYSPYY